jgi:hypothetical protein
MKRPINNWSKERENADGTGPFYYRCQVAQEPEKGGTRRLYNLCYSPKRKEIWFWDTLHGEGETTRMRATSWEDVLTVRRLLTIP